MKISIQKLFLQKPFFISLFFSVQILLIIAHIYKQTLFIKESYLQQKLEKTKKELDQENQKLTQELYSLQNYDTIATYARTVLKMEPLNIHHIKKLPAYY